MTPGEARLFIGLELPDAARQALQGIRRELGRVVSGKLYEPALYHITLHFLGQTPRRALPHLSALMDRVAFEPFELTLHDLGTFKGGAVLWAGVEAPCVVLHRLQGDLCDRLRGAGFPVETGAYTPHITLGRQVKILGELPDLPPVTFEIRQMTLFESTRMGGRLTYLPLYRSGI